MQQEQDGGDGCVVISSSWKDRNSFKLWLYGEQE